MHEDTRKYILVTDTFAGLGFADEHITKHPEGEVIIAYGFDESKMEKDKAKEQWEQYDKVGEGIVETFRMDKIMKNREEYRDWYWVFDGNHNVEENELLRKEGFKVVFGGEFCNKLENDREFGNEFAEECGLFSPDTHDFESFDDGIKFLEENEESAFVFKPNHCEENWMTYVPVAEDPINANLELREYMVAIEKIDKVNEGYILQKKVKGIEVNVEGFYMNGELVYAHANFENKKTGMDDTGAASGCAFDVEFTIPNNCKLFQITVGKFNDRIKEMKYTGFADANVIIGEFQDVYFLEFCWRWGYNSHCNLFFNLFEHTLLQCSADLYDGTFVPKVKDGFGASLTLFTEHYHTGLPIYIPDSLRNKTYLMDAYKEDDKLFMVGTDHEICLAMAHEYTIELALKNVVENGQKVLFPCRYARWDAYTNKDANSGPKRRWEGLNSMRMFDEIK